MYYVNPVSKNQNPNQKQLALELLTSKFPNSTAQVFIPFHLHSVEWRVLSLIWFCRTIIYSLRQHCWQNYPRNQRQSIISFVVKMIVQWQLSIIWNFLLLFGIFTVLYFQVTVMLRKGCIMHHCLDQWFLIPSTHLWETLCLHLSFQDSPGKKDCHKHVFSKKTLSFLCRIPLLFAM